MKTHNVGEIIYNEYVLKLEPDEENMLVEIGQKEIIKNKNECINYAVQFLLNQYMNDGRD